jgi:hypothetical protein
LKPAPRKNSNATANATARLAAALVLSLILSPGLTGCSHLGKLAFWRKAPQSAEISQELVVEANQKDQTGADAPQLPQSWQRNAVQLDLTSLGGEGSLKLRPLAGHGWPVRLEFLVRPGSFAQLEVHGDQRVVLTVPVGTGPVVLKLPSGVYSATSHELQLSWGGTVTDPATAPPPSEVVPAGINVQ